MKKSTFYLLSDLHQWATLLLLNSATSQIAVTDAAARTLQTAGEE